MVRYLGIRRQTEFSPNHVMSDRLIFDKTVEALGRRGVDVVVADEGDVGALPARHPLVFSMAQGPAASEALAQVERERNCLIVNSPRAVMSCYRTNMVRLLPAAGVPFPRSVIVDTANGLPPAAAQPGKTWVKRGDVHAVHLEDVTLAYRPEECAEVVEEFGQRGISHAILQEHIKGDVVKFYAVRGEDFFQWFYQNGGSAPFEAAQLRELADASAFALGLDVFGGDAIVGPGGSLTIIDVNDWPSFSAVRDTAAEAIASLLVRKARAHVGD
jgi:glutathione synthase/RimK-type ligase-like ATP-grasp enzyme